MTLSLCMIVKDEENTLPVCLDSVGNIADEIIIVDTGSNDGTVEAAKRYTSKIYHYPWNDNFAAARNFSFDKASMDCIFWLDADDIILPEDRQKLLDLKTQLSPETDICMLRYSTGIDESGRASLSFFRERIFRRSNSYKWFEPVHEYVSLWGNIEKFDISVTHAPKEQNHSDRNLKIYESLVKNGGELTPRAMYYYGRELKAHDYFHEAIEMFEKFLTSRKGWLEDNIAACFELSFCYSNLGYGTHALKTLLRSFEFAPPRAEACTKIGDCFFEKEQYGQAIFWYELALKVKKPDGWGFILEDYWGFIPNIQLCVCHDRLGNRKKAVYHHTKAKKMKPGDSAAMHNERYFHPKKITSAQ